MSSPTNQNQSSSSSPTSSAIKQQSTAQSIYLDDTV
jgi:hypothetical protein